MPVVQFSGWQVVNERRRVLRSGQAPRGSRAYTMYHGTHRSNASAIITGGFRPSAGGTLGPGVYCSRDIAKATGYPGGCSAGERVVLQLRVRVGRVKRMDGLGGPLAGGAAWQQSGYDSAWLPPRPGGHEEDCVADPRRLEVTGVAHCTNAATRGTLEQLIKQQRHGGGGGGGKGGKVGRGGGSAGTGVQGVCKGCGHKMKDVHCLELCWGCGSNVCPFMDKHVCHSRG